MVARIVSLALVLLAGCSSGPTERVLYLLGEEELNPNSKLASTPVNVRVYQLTDGAKFQEASFDALWSQEPAVLGDTLVRAERAVVTTKHETQVELVTDESVQFIGIVGLFNREEQPWKVCVAVDDVEDSVFRFHGYRILPEKR